MDLQGRSPTIPNTKGLLLLRLRLVRFVSILGTCHLVITAEEASRIVSPDTRPQVRSSCAPTQSVALINASMSGSNIGMAEACDPCSEPPGSST